MSGFLEKAKLLFQLKTTWVILVHLIVIFPLFAKIMFDAYYVEKTKKEERMGWINLGIMMLIIGSVYHLIMINDTLKFV
jgi:hypothetical protein